MTSRSSLERFVPRVTSEWDLESQGSAYRAIDGTLCFVDIFGFTNLSEKLARRGRIGAEELTDVSDRVFGEILRLAYDRGQSKSSSLCQISRKARRMILPVVVLGRSSTNVTRLGTSWAASRVRT